MQGDATISRLKVITPEGFEALVRQHIRYTVVRRADRVGEADLLRAVASSVRDLLVDRAMTTGERYARARAKKVAYISMEFLMGRALGNALISLGIRDMARDVVARLGGDLDRLMDEEPDPALGNGGLGRLAACFLDSLATLGMPGYGFGINYEYGLFRQTLVDGYQVEHPDHWLPDESPWMVERSSESIVVPLYGRVVDGHDSAGNFRAVWVDWQTVIGRPHDMPVPGFGGTTVNGLRLYSAKASNQFDMSTFNAGDYVKAVHDKVLTETISKVLYPSDTVESGRELRLVQEYFLVACSVGDILAWFRSEPGPVDWEALPDAFAIQLNDTHPSLVVAELMRQLVDENDVAWDRAWEITRAACGYTNHTLLPEALEKWPVALMERVLPRHMQIIREIDRRFLAQVAARWPGDAERAARMAIVSGGAHPDVRMAHLATVGSHSVNGVAALHTRLLRQTVMRDFAEMFPERFNNKTNGVTQRRFLLDANPPLSALITGAIGSGWITDLTQLRRLAERADDAGFLADLMAAKRACKERALGVVGRAADAPVDPASMFDVLAKRIHEYKRQLLMAMHVMNRYLLLVEEGVRPVAPRTFIFAGKAAPGYRAAKLIIKLITSVADVVNGDPRTKGVMRVAFVPNYRVTLAELLIPAADLSEQISTAGKEASGTGNMKFAMNGAQTICTLDGANIEMMEEVGRENIHVFGLTADEIAAMREAGTYDPRAVYGRSAAVRRVMDSLADGRWSPREPDLFRPIHADILDKGDPYFHAADLDAYLEAQGRVDAEFVQPEAWARKCLLNIAGMGRFSSDRTIAEYARDIWGVKPCL